MTCVRSRGGWKHFHGVRKTGYQREQAAGARKQVNTERLARQVVAKAQGGIMELHGEVQS